MPRYPIACAALACLVALVTEVATAQMPSGAKDAAAEASRAELSVCVEEVPASFDPAVGVARTAIPLGAAQVFDRLVDIAPDGVTIEPRLARWWDVSRDGLEYTFKLRRGVNFHEAGAFAPTRPLTAEDVAFTFARLIDPAHAFAPPENAANYAATLGFATLVAAVDAVEDDLVRFTLSRPNNAFLSMLAMDFASIQSAEYAADLSNSENPPRAIGEAPVGTGPFRLDTLEDGTARLVAHKRYWDGPPATGELVLRARAGATDRFAGLADGSCTIAVSPDPLDLETIASEGLAEIVRLSRSAVIYLAFNTERPAVAASDMRRRLAASIDRDELADALAVPAETAIHLTPPHPEAVSPEPNESETHVSSPAAAPPATITLLTATQDGSSESDALARKLADGWRTLGSDVDIVAVPWSGYADTIAAGEFDAAIVGFDPDTPDDALTLVTLLGCAARGSTNLTRWCDPQFDALLADAKSADDPVHRADALAHAREIAARELPAFPLVRPTVSVALSPEIEGLDAASLAKGDFRSARITENRATQPPGP